MPLIAIPTKARDLACKARTDAKSGDRYALGFERGVFEALRMLLPDDVMGCIIMDADCAADGEELYTDGLPRLVFK